MTSKERIGWVGYVKSDAKMPSCWKFWWAAMVQKSAKGSLISESGRHPWHSESRAHRFQHRKWQHHFASIRTQQCQTGTSSQPYPTRAASMVQANWMCSPDSLRMFHREYNQRTGTRMKKQISITFRFLVEIGLLAANQIQNRWLNSRRNCMRICIYVILDSPLPYTISKSHIIITLYHTVWLMW